ncbi:MAG: hypothetical protein WB780_00535 [Candidatus Acidiferrales bacterium]
MAATSQSSVATGRPNAFHTILIGGSIAGLLDGLDAVFFYRWAFAVPPTILFQHIASGLLGRQSFQGGWLTVVLGVACHLSIALGAAAVFYAASLCLPALSRMPFLFGPAFGIVVYAVMHYGVVPLSAITKRTAPVTKLELADQLFSHMFFVGLPIALMARKSARRTN